MSKASSTASVRFPTEVPLSRIRIGLVKEQLRQGVAERYVYELCRTIDGDRFEIELVSVEGTGLSSQHFGALLAASGIRIREELPVIRQAPSVRVGALRRLIIRLRYLRHRRRVTALFRTY